MYEAFDFNEILLQPREESEVNSRSEVILEDGDGVIPLIAANMDSIGTVNMARAMFSLNCMTALSKFYTKSNPEAIVALVTENPGIEKHIFVTVGESVDDLDSFTKILDSVGVNLNLCIDVANGHRRKFLRFVSMARKLFPNIKILAGNVGTVDGGFNLRRAGADIVKYGIGNGSVCTTRLMTGVGSPQASLINEVHHHRFGTGICSDGGCNNPGDIVKAFALGATHVMTGSLLSFTEECAGIIHIDENGYMPYYGMSSNYAMETNGNRARYRASEGRFVEKRCRGSVVPIVEEILGGIRSGCSYLGFNSLQSLITRDRGTVRFLKTTNHHNKLFE